METTETPPHSPVATAPPPADLAPPGQPPRQLHRAALRVVLGAALVGVVGLGAIVGVRVKEALAKREEVATARVEAQASALRKPPSAATHPKPTLFRARVEMTGTLKPWRESDVGFETAGRLTRVLVATGATVKDGQTLAVLDGTRATEAAAIKDASVRAAQANLALAEDTLRRTESLVASRSIPEAQAEQARQQVALARANLQAAQADAQFSRSAVGQHTIVAPFAAVVTRAPTAAGSVVQPGAPLVHLEDLSRLRLSASVGEDDAPLVHVGEAASVQYRDRTVVGRVIAIVPSLDPATRRAPVEIEVQNDAKDPLLAWSFVRVIIDSPRDAAVLRIPSAAHRAGSQDEVVRVENGKARFVRVAHVVDTDGSWVVRHGLTETDVVVLAPSADLRDGDAVGEIETGDAR